MGIILWAMMWCRLAGPVGAEEVVSPNPAANTLDISPGWRFRTDPQNIGLRRRWDGISLNDSTWRLTDTRGPWEERGAPGYDGVGWYRKWVEIPETWERVFLVLPGLADRADVFVQGTRAARNLRHPHPGTRLVVREITDRVAGYTRFLIALRITNDHQDGPGGFHSGADHPVMLVRDPRPLLPDRTSWLDYLVQQYPRLPWPRWMRRQGSAWITLGEPGAGASAIVGPHGQLVPVDREFAVSCWLYDARRKIFFAPEALPCTLKLDSHILPLPEIAVKAGRWFNLGIRYWPYVLEEPDGVTLAIGQVTVNNATDRTREVHLIVAVHPFSPQPEIFSLERVSYDQATRTILVDGSPAVVLAGAPDRFGAAPFAEPGSVARFFANGELPPQGGAVDVEEKLASGAAIYRFKIQPYGARTQTFRVLLRRWPDQMTRKLSARIRKVGRKTSLRKARSTWKRLLDGPEKLRLRIQKDKATQEAYYASLAHLYVTLTGIELTPAEPGGHDPGPAGSTGGGQASVPAPELSSRQRALTISALLRAGHAGTARQCLEVFLRAWSPAGPVTNSEIEPEAPGLAISGLMEYVRFTRDRAFLDQAYPAIVRACRALQRLRYQSILAGKEALPGSRRRTLAGEGDDAWISALGLRGWRHAEEAARLLGHQDDAAWMREQGERLRMELEHLYARVLAGGVRSPGNPALLWPWLALPTQVSGVPAGLDRIWAAWFEPFDGGCRPDGMYFPAVGLGLAHSWLLLGESERVQRVLDWHLKHQILPGTYAWSPAMESETLHHGGGDLPDPEAAAEYICLVRDMLLREESDALLLTTGLADTWPKSRRSIEVKQAPTWFGVFPGFSVSASSTGVTLRLLRSNTPGERFAPPRGIRWRVPGSRSIQRVTLDRVRAKDLPQDRWIQVPPGVNKVSVQW